jgi:hypothetical protein
LAEINISMKYYLSSYKFGNEIESLKKLIPSNNIIGHINNSRDFVGSDPIWAKTLRMRR